MFEITIFLALLITGLILILKGADWFVEAAVAIARHTGIPELMIGTTIVSLTTTLPEAFVSGMSAFNGHTDLAVGNAVGSNICNIGLVLGGSLMFTSIKVEKKLLYRQGLIMVVAGFTFYLLAMSGSISYFEGMLLFSGLLAYTFYLVKQTKSSVSLLQSFNSETGLKLSGVEDMRNRSPNRYIMRFGLGAAMLLVGSRLVLEGSTRLAATFGISELIISLTLVSISTSLPELFTCIAAVRKEHNAILLGNVMGANILNIMLVVAVSALIRPLPLQQQSLLLDFPVMLILMLALLVAGIFNKNFTRREGTVFLGIYLAYLFALAMITFIIGDII